MKMEYKFDFVKFGCQNILNYKLCYQGMEFIGAH